MKCYMKFCIIGINALIICVASIAAYGQENLQLRMIKVAHGDGRLICATAKAALSPDGKITFDQMNNTLVVVDRAKYIPHIEELVSKLDIKVPLVEISVRVAEVEKEFLQKAGIRSSQIIYPRGSFDVTLGMLNTRSGAFTKSDITLRTTSGISAQLQVSRQSIFGASADNVTNKDNGDMLEVLPLANFDNTVTVQLRPARSNAVDDSVVNDSSALTQVTLFSGDTLAIANVDSQASDSRRKTLMFLTAKIIY